MNDITAEQLQSSGTKGRLEKLWVDYRAAKNEDPPDVHRHPSTCVGFLTKEKLHEMLSNPNPDMLLIGAGLALIDDDQVAFFADDGNYGWDLMPKYFGRCSLSNIHHNYGEDKRYKNVDDIINTFFQGKRFLNSLEELVEYLNRDRVADFSFTAADEYP